MKKVKFIFLLLVSFQVISSQDFFDLAPTPPMGWNSWNWFGKNEINETVVREVIDAMVDEGMRDAGYQYVVVDGGWRDTILGPSNELLSHPLKFPGGMKVLADYAHSKGLKFGLHTVPGTHDCKGDKVGGFNCEEVHIQQFLDWQIDYIKLDQCIHSDGWNEELLKNTYFKWSRLLQDCDRDIVLSISAYHWREWYPEVGHLGRTTRDLKARVTKGAIFESPEEDDKFHHRSVMFIAELNNQNASNAGMGYWNDPDMLAMGDQGLTLEEQRSHFALWCIMSAPLMIGNDPRNMTPEEKDIILNRDAIAINQDPGQQGKKIVDTGDNEIWAKHLQNDKVAILMLNRNREQVNGICLDLKLIGNYRKIEAKEVYSGEFIGTFKGSICRQVNPGSGIFLLLSPKTE